MAATKANGNARPPEKIQRLVIDKNGDIVVRIAADGGFETGLFLVCSRTLRRASTMWDRVIPTLALTTSGRMFYQLNEDGLHWPIFQMLMHICHGHFDKVPPVLAVERLWLLVRAAEKLEMTAVLRPWASSWLSGIRMRGMRSHSLEAASQTAGISWALGDLALFTSATDRLIIEVDEDEDGDLIDPKDSTLLENSLKFPNDLHGKRSPSLLVAYSGWVD